MKVQYICYHPSLSSVEIYQTEIDAFSHAGLKIINHYHEIGILVVEGEEEIITSTCNQLGWKCSVGGSVKSFIK